MLIGIQKVILLVSLILVSLCCSSQWIELDDRLQEVHVSLVCDFECDEFSLSCSEQNIPPLESCFKENPHYDVEWKHEVHLSQLATPKYEFAYKTYTDINSYEAKSAELRAFETEVLSESATVNINSESSHLALYQCYKNHND